ncbi:MAG: 30S ribosomal protein S20 [Minisyncoccia bacterium]
MPITKSAKKALRQNIRRRKINLQRKAKMKAVIKTYKKSIISKNKEEAIQNLNQAYKVLDKLAKVKFIHQNKASRLKSKLAKKLKVINQK